MLMSEYRLHVQIFYRDIRESAGKRIFLHHGTHARLQIQFYGYRLYGICAVLVIRCVREMSGHLILAPFVEDLPVTYILPSNTQPKAANVTTLCPAFLF